MPILQAIWFYVIFSGFGFIALPISRKIFSGQLTSWLISKMLGLMFFGYTVWLLATLRIINYQNLSLITLGFICLMALGIWFSRNWFLIPQTTPGQPLGVRLNWSLLKKLLGQELFLLVIYLLYLLVRSFNPAINGTERFMDLALLQAAGKTEYFPFIDPWYAGKTVNYYYFGAYLMSLISNLSRLSYLYTYNFALSWVFVVSVGLAGLLGVKLTRKNMGWDTDRFFGDLCRYLVLRGLCNSRVSSSAGKVMFLRQFYSLIRSLLYY